MTPESGKTKRPTRACRTLYDPFGGMFQSPGTATIPADVRIRLRKPFCMELATGAMDMQHAFMYRDRDNRVVVVERTPHAFERVDQARALTPMFDGQPVPRLIVDAFLRQFGGLHVTGFGTETVEPEDRALATVSG